MDIPAAADAAPSPTPAPHLDRRALLRLGLAAGAAGTLGATSVVGAPAAKAAGPIPVSKRFDLHASSEEVFRGKVMHSKHHAIQGIAFDDVNQRMFVSQLQDGDHDGDLCVSQISTSGTVLGAMHLANAGHGVSIGIEPVGSTSYVWMECDASGSGTAARGTAIARFPFRAGTAPVVTRYFTGSNTVTVATDPVHHRLAMRRIVGGSFQFTVYDLQAGRLSAPLVTRTMPDVNATGQGWTLYGQYIYHVTGNTKKPGEKINSTIWCFDLNSGNPARVVESFVTEAGKSLYYREPEGIAIHRPKGGQVGLYFGYGSRVTGHSGDARRYASVYRKQGWV